jgi:predicted TIM-barrel fold metal-dependent hydrolase
MPSKKRSRRGTSTSGSIDVHCHVFNARDVPIRKFVELVYLEKYPGGSLLDPLIDFIELIMRSGAPTTRQEIDELTQANLVRNRLRPRGTRANNIRVVSRALMQMLLGSRKDRLWVRKHFAPRLRRKFRGKRKWVLMPHDFRETALYLMGLSDIGTWIDFALIYTKWRWEITEQLTSLSPTQARDVILYTPAILDIGTRLGEGDTSPIVEQVAVMSLISQLKSKNYAVHPFVAFDPFRAIDDPNAIENVKDAVLHQGAIGVKVYPPMGFKPLGNGGSLGGILDTQMRNLLQFCLAEDVPILAHCSFSQFVRPAEGACAAPEAWRLLLNNPTYKYLRLDLGHCGGPWDFDANSQTKTIWTETVIDMLGVAKTKYPNLYADVSDDSWIIESTPDDRDKDRKLMYHLLGLLQTNPTARTRLLYGSDWSLLAREADANLYYNSMKTRFCSYLNFSPAEIRGYLGGNAVRFLGLAKNQDGSKPRNRQRLEQFRGDHGLDMSIFNKIDALNP